MCYVYKYQLLMMFTLTPFTSVSSYDTNSLFWPPEGILLANKDNFGPCMESECCLTVHGREEVWIWDTWYIMLRISVVI